jgi:hypothetical protein
MPLPGILTCCGRVARRALALVLPGCAAGQLSFTPTVGAFVPLRDQSRWSWTDCCIAGSSFTETLRTDLSSAMAFGLKVDMTWGSALGVEASVATAFTKRRLAWSASAVPNPPPPDEFAALARTTIATLLLKSRKGLGRTGGEVAVGLGPSLVVHTREAFCGSEPPCVENLTTFGPTLDVALSFPVTPRTRFALVVVNNFYSIRYAEPPFPGRDVDPDQSRFWQHDVMASVGVAFVLKR